MTVNWDFYFMVDMLGTVITIISQCTCNICEQAGGLYHCKKNIDEELSFRFLHFFISIDSIYKIII